MHISHISALIPRIISNLETRTGVGMGELHTASPSPLWALFIFIELLFSHCSISTSAKVPAIIVFGDSSVDSGNNNFIPTIARSNFEPYGRDFYGGHPTGRFSNGRIAPDFISEAFGLRPTVPAYLDPAFNISDFAVGVCFASAGTGFDNATSSVADVIPLWKEVEYYKEYQKKLRAHLGTPRANEILSEALYLVSIGTNDFLENYFAFPIRQTQTVEEYEEFLIGLADRFLRDLYGLGARKVSLTGVPPMGCLPLERTMNMADWDHGCLQQYNDVALQFNAKLGGLVSRLNAELPGFQIVDANAYDLVMQIVAHPSRFGFEEASVGCCGTGTFEMGFMCDPHSPFTCTDANKYVFWDAIHPSQKTSHLVSNYLIRNHLSKFL